MFDLRVRLNIPALYWKLRHAFKACWKLPNTWRIASTCWLVLRVVLCHGYRTTTAFLRDKWTPSMDIWMVVCTSSHFPQHPASSFSRSWKRPVWIFAKTIARKCDEFAQSIQYVAVMAQLVAVAKVFFGGFFFNHFSISNCWLLLRMLALAIHMISEQNFARFSKRFEQWTQEQIVGGQKSTPEKKRESLVSGFGSSSTGEAIACL